MTPTTFFSLLAAIAVGVTFIFWGRRGKRLNKNPTCRDCRFDLLGIYPDAITCPECGAGLNRHSAIRAGARKTRWLPILLGIPLILLPGATLALVTFAAITGQSVNDYKPLRLLLWEGEYGTVELVQSSGEYLYQQYTKGKLTDEQVGETCDAALRIQGNVDRPWHASWGDLLEDAYVAGSLSNEKFDRYYEQAAVVEVTTRERVLLGASIPLRIEVSQWRTGSHMLKIASVDVNRYAMHPLRADESAKMRTPAMEHSLKTTVTWSMSPGSALPMYRTRGSSTSLVALEGLVPTESGPCTLSLDTQLFVTDDRLSARGVFRQQRADSVSQHVRHLQAVDEHDLVRPASVNSKIRSQLREKLEPRSIVLAQYYRPARAGTPPTQRTPVHPSKFALLLAFDTFDAPVDFAFDVFFEQNGRRWRVGALVSREHVRTDSVASLQPQSPARRIDADLEGMERAPWRLRLVPSAQIASGTIEITSIFDEELVYQDLELAWDGWDSLPQSTP